MLGSLKLSMRAILLGCGGAMVLFIGVAVAFVLSGQDWTYQADPMGEDYIVCENTADTAGEGAAIRAAAATWNLDAANFDFTDGGNACNAAPAFDNINQIRWGATGGSLATTTWWFNAANEILEADCEFEDAFTWSTAAVTPAGEYDVQTVMLHEFGHYLSLGHDVPPAIMQPTIPSGTQRRTLDQDDRDGIRAIYGSCSALGASASITSPGLAQTVVNFGLLFAPLFLILMVRVFSARKGVE